MPASNVSSSAYGVYPNLRYFGSGRSGISSERMIWIMSTTVGNGRQAEWHARTAQRSTTYVNLEAAVA